MRTDLHFEQDAARDEVEALRVLAPAACAAGYHAGFADARVRAFRVLAELGCDCPCQHHHEEHDDDCERCVTCRIETMLRSDT